MEGLNEEQIAEFKEAFALFDKDGDNIIETKVMQCLTQELPFVIRSLYQTPTEKDLKDWQKEVDPENTGRVDFPQFLSLMARKYKEPDTEDELIEAMTSIFNPDGPTISLREFRNTMTNLGEKLTEQELDELFKETDLNKEEHFNYEEFVRIILSK